MVTHKPRLHPTCGQLLAQNLSRIDFMQTTDAWKRKKLLWRKNLLTIGIWNIRSLNTTDQEILLELNNKNVYYSIIKVSDLFFCENLVDYNEARLHEATLNIYTHT